jgi:hypothetical protein
MADPKTFRVRRKQDGWVSEPITQEQAEGIAGWPGDYEKLPEVKPLVVKAEPVAAPRTAAADTKSEG